MGCYNSLGGRRNSGFYQGRIQAKRLRVDIHKYRLAVLPDKAASGGNVRKWGGYYLALHGEGTHRKLQGQRAIAHQYYVSHT
ncbi:hypothetical protein GCM10027175_12990 [Hymenobacter latericoloratus]